MADEPHRKPSKFYTQSMAFLDKLVPKALGPLWHHAAGPKTVFFWMPAFKWGLVLAAISDLARPAERINLLQTFSIGLTGFVWCRYSVVIIPKNYALVSVNAFVGLSQYYLFSKGLIHRLRNPKT